MSEKSDLHLHSVSVVILANAHNPSILSPSFLESNGIVPKDWKVVETVTTPAVSFIRYDNGVQWTVDQQRLTIIDKCNISFYEKYDGPIHCLAKSYVEKLPYVVYLDLGLNCIVSTVRKNSRQWVTEQFLKPNSYKAKLTMTPKFSIELDGHVLNLEIVSKSASRNNNNNNNNSNNDNPPSDSVIVHCNFHYDKFSDSALLCEKISEWNDTQKSISSVLCKILEGS